jgi:RNA polymerase sigma-70 factor (ECF subfamily)
VPGQQPPFEDLYREFLPRIFAYVRVQLGNSADAEDVTAQVFIKAYEAYGRFEPRASTPAAWLFRIARNATLDHHRGRGRRDRLERTVSRQPQETTDPSRLAEDNLQYEAVLRALAELPQRQREVISLRQTGLSFLEAGTILGCSEDAAKMLYHRALKALRERTAGVVEP